ncbi:lysylphosphatidylglycerol synthase transmembrane domain-containing protein [Salegentibacter sp. F188]|uniref:Lysylphosphatidylglycerol synthase transmembrane domain-containing protein n=1 Tax=Autumnicola patrickiae TaxID=3075591 RepID=A0ABU3E434_9FLAO|nr:lysylphosphatidylglycerol synthase transmembrane domain-containing protein [Salegentibacter sp. F188]MDT0690758.1 lysylphosphatidylglycerol synthase transmembrane domain-containing protein [Salegentibacter sp. F188]
MKKRTIKLLKIIIPLSLGIFLIWYSLQSATPSEREELLDNILTANPFWIMLSMTFGALSHLSRAYRWKFLLEPLGYTPGLANSFMAVMVGYLANFGIPRSGEVLRAVTLSSYEKVPFEKGFGTIISERIADMLILLLIVAVTIALQTDNLLTYFEVNNINPLVSIGILFVLVFIGVLVLQFIKRSQWSIAMKVRELAKGLLEGMKSILKMRKKWEFILHTIFIWVMYVLMFYVIVFTVPETANASVGAVMAAFVVGSFAISATNGGIGVYPVAIGAILMLYGISKQGGEAFGWILWGSQTLMVLVFGGLSFIILPLLNRKK